MYLGLFHSVFNTYNKLYTMDSNISYNNYNKKIYPYNKESSILDTPLYEGFDFNQLDNYNENVFNLNVLNENFNPMPMDDAYLNSFFQNKYAESWNNGINQ